MDAVAKRALSRAAVLQSLEDKFVSNSTAVPKNSSSVNSNARVEVQSSSAQQESAIGQAVQIFMSVVSSSDKYNEDKAKKFFSENLSGKTIILDNSRLVEKASSAQQASALSSKGKHRNLLSNTALKRKNLASKIPMNSQDVLRLHMSWQDYIQSVLKNSKSAAQLQARMFASPLVGATVMVVHADNEHIVGTKGVISAESRNLFYVSTIPTREDSSKICNETDLTQYVIRKNTCVLEILLPKDSDCRKRKIWAEETDRITAETAGESIQRIVAMERKKTMLWYGEKYFK